MGTAPSALWEDMAVAVRAEIIERMQWTKLLHLQHLSASSASVHVGFYARRTYRAFHSS
jgi:hypothetical protein